MPFLELAGVVGVYTGLAVTYVKFLDWLDGPKRRQCKECGRQRWIKESELFSQGESTDDPTRFSEEELEALGRNQIARNVCSCHYRRHLEAKRERSEINSIYSTNRKNSSQKLASNQLYAAEEIGSRNKELNMRCNVQESYQKNAKPKHISAYVIDDEVVKFDVPANC